MAGARLEFFAVCPTLEFASVFSVLKNAVAVAAGHHRDGKWMHDGFICDAATGEQLFSHEQCNAMHRETNPEEYPKP